MPEAIRDKDLVLQQFAAGYPFVLDEFQRGAIAALAEGRSVMVAAPTGTGKTVVAEFGVYLARLRGLRVMYTTPIKALSNQKFRDFRKLYGDDVGLLTGDVVENRGGRILVMTTEVLRNMILQTPRELDDVGVVIFDEVHYIADPERGTAWEESIVLAPAHLQLVCLSATVTNAAEIATWISLVHRPIQLIEHFGRAVPLQHYYFLDNQLNEVLDEQGHLIADFPNVGGEARRRMGGGWMAGEEEVRKVTRPEPDPIEIVQALQRAEMLPAIYFLFSRRDCEAAADVCAMMRLRLTRDPRAMREISRIVQSHLDRLAPEDRVLEQVKAIVRLTHRGLGFHHAGLLPVLKQLVEELFSAGLMGAVFATDTLALGINMPARTVVVGRMSKFDGQTRRPLIPNEFQQMAGRAGRRGIDLRGYVVIPYSPWMPFREAIDIASGPLYPVQSSFTLRYNTVLNLWDSPSGDRVLRLQRDSLMQFQMAHQTRELAERVQHLQHEIDSVPRGCLIGYEDGEELLSDYDSLTRTRATLRHDREHLEREDERLMQRMSAKPWTRPTREQLRRAFRVMEPGSLIHLEEGGWAIFVGRQQGNHGPGLFLIADRVERVESYHLVDYFPSPPIVVPLPAHLRELEGPVSELYFVLPVEERLRLEQDIVALPLPDIDSLLASYRAELEASLSRETAKVRDALDSGRRDLQMLETRISQHLCDPCPVRKQHRRNLRDAARLMQDRSEAERELDRHISFEEQRAQRILGAIVSILHQFGYLRRGHSTPKAAHLANIFDSNGLLISEALATGALDELSAEDLAEVFSWFAYDRDLEFANRYMLPHHLVRLRRDLDELQSRIAAAERRNDIILTIGYNYYFYGMARAWARGATFQSILDKVSLGEGDLVMTLNKTGDLLRQVEDMLAKVASSTPLRQKLVRAQALMRRGIIEQSLTMGTLPQPIEQSSALPKPIDQTEAPEQAGHRLRPKRSRSRDRDEK